jgi:predicted ferric reductase
MLISLGLFIGGIIAIIGLWLWLDYQADPAHNLLTSVGSYIAAGIPGSIPDFLKAQIHLMGLPLAAKTSAYWYMSRAGGIIAYLLLWLSTVWGLLLSTKIIKEWVSMPLIYGLHEFLAIAALGFAALHSLALLGDEYVTFSLWQLLIPFTASYKPFWTGLGTISFYLGLVLTGSFYIRKWIGQKTWRLLHYLTFGMYGLAMVHGLMAGTDSPLALLKLMYLGTGLSTLFLVYYRLFTLKEKAPRNKLSH